MSPQTNETATKHTAMSTLQTQQNDYQLISPPPSFIDSPLTPPPTDEKPYAQAPRVIKLFKDREAGRFIKQDPLTEFQLVPGEYNYILDQLRRDESLYGYVRNKIRYVSFKE